MEIQAAIVLIIVFFLLLAFSVPVSFSIISASLVTLIMFLTPHFGVFISAQKMVTGIDSFTLLAVPFFVLAGLLMSNGGIAKRLINLAMLVLGKVPGSLAMTNIAGNAMFGSISGSGIAAATAIGGVMQPLENEQGYDRAFSAAANVASAPVGQLIPPTASFIVFSAASGGVSVAALLGVSDNKIVILLIINLILLIVGTFMDMAPALLIFTPIFLPVVKALGMNPIQFGVMMVMNLSIGTITPPVGSVLFVGCSISHLQVEEVIKKLVPFFVAILVALLFVTFVPQLSMWLPTVFGLLG